MGVLVGYKALVFFLVLLLHAVYSFLKLRTQLHMLQLNSYFLDRYLAYCRRSLAKLWDIRDLEPLFALLGVWMASPDLTLLISILIYCKILLSYQPPANIKKKLIFTVRVWRLTLVCALVWLIGYYYCWQLWVAESTNYLLVTVLVLLGYILLLPLILSFCNILVIPLEYAIYRYYFNDAKRILAGLDGLKRVAITGSFGKTTTKYILNALLSDKFITLKTPSSYNTPMGVAKVVREQLRPLHQVLVTEMSARLPGDIRELCKMVRPQYGLITAIGEQHLEYFKDLKHIQDTKYELIDELPKDGSGIAFFNLDDPNSKVLIERTKKVRVVTFSLKSPKADYYAGDIGARADGSYFKLWIRGVLQKETFNTILLGETNLCDIVAAIAVASELGVSTDRLAAIIPTITPVPHRLELRVGANGTMLIDDSYNANPIGSRQALEVLSSFAGGRKFMVTPGMIELGKREDYYNHEFAKAAARVCDYVIIVGKHCRHALLAGLQEANYPGEQIIMTEDFYQARDHLQQVTKAGDVVLFENDFTDDYEGN